MLSGAIGLPQSQQETIWRVERDPDVNAVESNPLRPSTYWHRELFGPIIGSEFGQGSLMQMCHPNIACLEQDRLSAAAAIKVASNRPSLARSL
jgi:hypothetical protein